jgi:hypothetical protein
MSSCQSCGMPLVVRSDFGSDRNGRRIPDFCNGCYRDGAFTEPEVTMPEMIDRGVAAITGQLGMPECGARAMLTDVLPHLKRWECTPAGGVR